MATERGILMSAWSVGRMLADAKSQTRRPIKGLRAGPWPEGDEFRYTAVYGGKGEAPGEPYWHFYADDKSYRFTFEKPPLGVPGDLLYCKEALTETAAHFARYAADGKWVEGYETDDHYWKWKRPLLNARFMPKWAARPELWRRITDVRAQRVQEISEADAIAEGVDHGPMRTGWLDYELGPTIMHSVPAEYSFKTLWDSIYAARGLGFEANPWVFAYTFERIERKEASA